MADISDVISRYFNIDTLLRFLADRGTSYSSTNEWRRIIRSGEFNETELQDAIKLFMFDATNEVLRAVKEHRRVPSPPRAIPDDPSTRFTDLSQFDDCKNSQESSNSSTEVILLM